jgi:hypothetical protein
LREATVAGHEYRIALIMSRLQRAVTAQDSARHSLNVYRTLTCH